MLWTKTIKQIKDLQTRINIKLNEINEIKQKVYLHEYQIKNIEIYNKVWPRILENKIKEIEKKQKEVKKKK